MATLSMRSAKRAYRQVRRSDPDAAAGLRAFVRKNVKPHAAELSQKLERILASK